MTGSKTLVSRFGMLLAGLAVMLMSIAPGLATNASAQWSAPRTVYFQETGQSLDQMFLDAWRSNNGWANYGLPITPEIEMADGHIVQYLEYARFEYWPNGDANGNYFVLGKVGEDMRPTMLQRSAIASTNSPGNVSRATDMVRAWMPVQPDAPVAIDPEVTYVEATGHTVYGAFRDFWWSTGDVNYLGNPLTQEYTIGDTTYQVFEFGQLSWTADMGVQMVPLGKLLTGKYDLSTEKSAQGELPTYDEALFIPPVPSFANYSRGGGEVWLDVNLSYEYMTVYQGNTVLAELYISTGKPGFETPPGTFYVNSMLPSQDMEGVIGGEYYNVPEVPYVMYFTNVGHAIHGTYWHNNFGTPMSHGCINMPIWAAENLYNIAYIGMRVEIHW